MLDWIFLYRPKLVMVKEYMEKCDFLYVIDPQGKREPIKDYPVSMLGELIEINYTLLRLYSKREYRDKLREKIGNLKIKEVEDALHSLE